MNLYVCKSDYVEAKTFPIVWQAQMIIAPNLKVAKKILPFGTKRKVELLLKDIDKVTPKAEDKES